MSSVPADKRITAFEKDRYYSYSIIAQANENYTFASKDALSVMLNGEDFTDISEVILDGKILMIGPEFAVPVEQKEIELIEISDATVSFNIDDKPVFTGTVDDYAPYVLDYEGWFGEDGEFISSSEYWNSVYVERDWCDGLISSFKENTEYTYQLYLKLTDEAALEGYVFGPNTKLSVNGNYVEYQHSDENSLTLQIETDLTMTPTKPTDNPTDKPTQNGENETPTTDVPKTADSESAVVWFAVMLISVAGTAIALSKKRHAE